MALIINKTEIEVLNQEADKLFIRINKDDSELIEIETDGPWWTDKDDIDQLIKALKDMAK